MRTLVVHTSLFCNVLNTNKEPKKMEKKNRKKNGNFFAQCYRKQIEKKHFKNDFTNSTNLFNEKLRLKVSFKKGVFFPDFLLLLTF